MTDYRQPSRARSRGGRFNNASDPMGFFDVLIGLIFIIGLLALFLWIGMH